MSNRRRSLGSPHHDISLLSGTHSCATACPRAPRWFLSLTVCGTLAYADQKPAGNIVVTPLSPAAVASIQSQLLAAIDAVKAKNLNGEALDAALSDAVARVMVQEEKTYGPSATGQIASIILASTAIPSADLGDGLGRAAAELAEENFGVGRATAQTVANEGSRSAVSGCASGAEAAGGGGVAKVCEGKPEVTAAVAGPNNSPTSAVVNVGGFAPPPPPRAPACSNPPATDCG